jgi:hypothetical protein
MKTDNAAMHTISNCFRVRAKEFISSSSIYHFALLRVIRVASAAGATLVFRTFAGGGFVRVVFDCFFSTAALCGDTLADFDLERDCKQSTDQCTQNEQTAHLWWRFGNNFVALVFGWLST